MRFLVLAIVLILFSGCGADHYQRIKSEIQAAHPDVKPTVIYKERLKSILDKFYDSKVVKQIPLEFISVYLDKNSVINVSGRYYPIFLSGITLYPDAGSIYSGFEPIIHHELCHKIWYEALPYDRSQCFKSEYFNLDNEVRRCIEDKINKDYSLWKPFLRWTERYSEVAELIMKRCVALVPRKRMKDGKEETYHENIRANIPNQLFEAYRGVFKDEYLKMPETSFLMNVALIFKKHKPPPFEFRAAASLAIIDKLWQCGGVFLKDKNGQYYLHYWTNPPPKVVIYDIDSRKIERYEWADFEIVCSLDFIFIQPSRKFIVFGAGKIKKEIVNEKVAISLDELHEIARGGFEFQ
ncbi:MAG: hypothetical protein HY602_01375 [Parcubacteria group bacterium]|nr:hypothetical protein [Parcubacteria group bacterium]